MRLEIVVLQYYFSPQDGSVCILVTPENNIEEGVGDDRNDDTAQQPITGQE